MVQGYLVEEQGMTYTADMDTDNPLAPLQAASCTYRIALGARARQKVLRLRAVPGRERVFPQSISVRGSGALRFLN